METKRPKYRILSFTTSNKDDERQWSTLEIQLYGTRFRIRVSPTNFRNSPVRSAEFQNASRAPPPLVEYKQLTLSDFLDTAFFECELTATDDILAPVEITPVESDEDCWPSSSSSSSSPPNSEPRNVWTTSFPSFSPPEVTVIYDDLEHPFDSNPAPSPDPDDAVARKEVETYERIATATNLGAPGVRTSRLFGVEDTPLTFAVTPETLTAVMERWAQQIRGTLAALHRAGITWGDAKPDNVLIDVHGNAWIVDFGGGRTEGWVDSAKAETVEGDLQALERILDFIERGGEGRGLSDG
ncbi:uncharacterized protein B0T15DRAFT_563816 [Chaetomium strumarium]|uniref:Protein kinase domain-containing protein n=1 Tax=Chaetomium strumarium TaxID=1170767 RepID=A0AAJ0M5D2_9PEZI|nr:hypothetical protein B0T15DRAFT_563816 [Chaetomium strumarium]